MAAVICLPSTQFAVLVIWGPRLILGVIRVGRGGPHRYPTCCLTVMRPGTAVFLPSVGHVAVHSQHGG